MKASDLFVKALENEGVTHIFAVPGEENLDVVESLRESSIELVLLRHEQGAAFMAATYGRLTGKAGVCMATLGPGATNFVTASAYAQLGGMPMMMITGQKPIKQSSQGQFQIVDVVEMMRPITKYTKQIVNGHTIPPIVREAFRVAERERPGAVHLELPEDIAGGIDKVSFGMAVAAIGLEKARVIVVGNKADFVAVFLLRHPQSGVFGKGANFALLVTADGQQDSAQQRTFNAEQDVGLVLFGVAAAVQRIPARGILLNLSIVTGGDVIRAHLFGKCPQLAKLQPVVALHTRVGRATGQILVSKIVFDTAE